MLTGVDVQSAIEEHFQKAFDKWTKWHQEQQAAREGAGGGSAGKGKGKGKGKGGELDSDPRNTTDAGVTLPRQRKEAVKRKGGGRGNTKNRKKSRKK